MNLVNINEFMLRYFGKDALSILIVMQKQFHNHKNK